MRHQTETVINDHWHFRLGDLALAELARPEQLASWDSVTLPHTWNALDTLEPEPTRHYARAVGWYARVLEPAQEGRRLWVEFEAASQRASIWLNGRQIGEHAGGYTAFTVELTAQEPGPLLLAARVDNLPARDLIPSDMSDFYLYGGLTRNVHCYTTGPRRLAGLRCETEVVANHAHLSVRGKLDAPPPGPLTVEARLYSPQGRLLGASASEITQVAFKLLPFEINQPWLWSPDSPELYTLEVTLRAGEQVWDIIRERLGLRFFAFSAGGPFLLNGRPLKLHGTHRHEDWAGLGSAVPDELIRQELRLIKEAGLNFIRLGHYPQGRAVLEACDELGLLIWEELPWCRGGLGGEVFRRHARTMLREMIEQHFHHPSIIFWGLGNELDWDSEHPDSTEESIAAFLAELHALARQLDPQRLTALRRFGLASQIVDVYSPSLWSGWYAGRYQDYERAMQEELQSYPRMLHMEWGGDSHYGRHSAGGHLPDEITAGGDHAEIPGLALSHDGPVRASRDGDWSESYLLDVMEWHLQVQLRTPQLAGHAQWIFKDFATPLRPENPIPYVNQKGLLDRAGLPKDLYYLCQSYLTTAPMCYIESPTWPVRSGLPGDLQRVRVYSNCLCVILFVNGTSAGKRLRDSSAFPAAGLVWQVALQPGANILLARAEAADGRIIEHAITVEYSQPATGPATGWNWQIEPGQTPDGRQGLNIALQLIDVHGLPLLTDRRRVTFALEGPGELWDRQGIVGGSRIIELANGRGSILVLGAQAGSTLLVEVPAMAMTRIPVRHQSAK